MGKETPQNTVDWREVAIVRARDLRLRLVFSVLIALTGLFVGGRGWPFVWLPVTALTQFGATLVTEPLRKDPALQMSPGRERAFYAALFSSAAVFASCGAFLWFDGGSGGHFFALIVLAGGMVNVALQAGGCMRQLVIASTPFALLLQGLPVISFLRESGPERQVLGLMCFGSTLMILHLGAAARRTVANTARTEAALREAKQERQRAEAASAAKSDFLGAMSHELRTPLNGVLGMAQALEGERLSLAQRERVQVIRRSGESLLMLLNDLLDISRIETARLELDAGVVEPEALAEQAQSVFGPLAEAKQVDLRVRALKSAGPARLGDPMRVRQVLHNLIGNAIQATATGHISVVISGAADQLIFEVSDTSPGVAPDRLANLFERFGERDTATAGPNGGSTLGLAIARGLARLMGGDIAVRSRPGDGSVFTARLRLPQTELVAPAPAEPAEPLEQRLRVLAAEDNPTNQLVLKTLLQQLGVSVHLVADGQAAVEAWRAAAWDLVLMDIQMPLMDGLAATRAIRALEAAEGRVRTPIVAVTANATARQASEYMAAGMDGLAPKPIQLGQLLAVVRDALGGAPDEQSADRSAA